MEKLSHQIEDYLKTIYLLQQRAGGASTNAIAAALSVKPASVTGMIKKLAEMKLANHAPYQGVTLTPAAVRSPHILSIHFPRGFPDGLPERLAAENVHVARRLGRLRISPHVYNDAVDVDRFIEAFRRLYR